MNKTLNYILLIVFLNGLAPLVAAVVFHYKDKLDWNEAIKQGYITLTAICCFLLYIPMFVHWLKRKK